MNKKQVDGFFNNISEKEGKDKVEATGRWEVEGQFNFYLICERLEWV